LGLLAIFIEDPQGAAVFLVTAGIISKIFFTTEDAEDTEKTP
jgi:hypothetical protein